jgi:glycosyltransferase involved in cell wall biosynthesis
MDELASRCEKVAFVMRPSYQNTYDYRLRCLSTCFNLGVSRQIGQSWKDIAPDVVHVNKQNLEDGLDLLRASRYSGLPTVSTVHLTQSAGYLAAKLGSVRDAIARFHLRRFRGTFVGVQNTRSAMLDEFVGQEGRSKTVLNGVPAIEARSVVRDEQRRELGIGPNEFLILGVGRLVDQKRPFEFLRLAREIHARIPSTRFLWVGDGELAAQWQAESASYGLGQVIRCTGWCDDVVPYLLAGDLLLHVAKFEGLPFAIVEAVAAGLPCAVSGDLLRDMPILRPDAALVADDVDELARRIADPDALEAVRASGRKLYREMLSVERMAESYEALYVAAIGRGRH